MTSVFLISPPGLFRQHVSELIGLLSGALFVSALLVVKMKLLVGGGGFDGKQVANIHFCKSLRRNLQGSMQGGLPTTAAYNYTQQASLLKVVHVYKHSQKCTDKHAILQTPCVCALVSALEQAGQGG